PLTIDERANGDLAKKERSQEETQACKVADVRVANRNPRVAPSQKKDPAERPQPQADQRENASGGETDTDSATPKAPAAPPHPRAARGETAGGGEPHPEAAPPEHARGQGVVRKNQRRCDEARD